MFDEIAKSDLTVFYGLAGLHVQRVLNCMVRKSMIERKRRRRLHRSHIHRQCEKHLTLMGLLGYGKRMQAVQFLPQHRITAGIAKIGYVS
ncbi:MAG: hypothetical protein ABI642_01695 [Polaromonas sp.]